MSDALKIPVPQPDSAELNLAVERTDRVSRFLDWSSEFCSSILVKESRQALKSKQFLWTYFLLLFGVALWTVLGIATAHSNYRLDSAGPELLSGFLMILAFPLCITIPFSAYQSLAREYEDGTIQLISITTMKPHQIVMGKFGSAILQIMLYLSVLAPCILFTYLLRGISLDQILFGLGICVGGSICLTILGLFLAGAVRSRAISIGISVLFVLFLGWLYWLWCIGVYELLQGRFPGFQDPEVIVVCFTAVALAGSLALVLLAAASSQISFPSDNRATKIRLALIVQQIMAVATVVAWMQQNPYADDLFLGSVFVGGHYWLITGFLMMGESPALSRRVQRSLPRNAVTRSLVSWLMPGPGRGFLFAVIMAWTGGLALALLMVFQWELLIDAEAATVTVWGGRRGWRLQLPQTIAAIFVACCYVTLFLSITFLITRLVFRFSKRDFTAGGGHISSLIIGFLVVLVMTAGATIWHMYTRPYGYNNGYASSQVFNWYWTVTEIASRRGYGQHILVLFVAAIPSTLIVLFAFGIAARELRYRPAAIPRRVQEEIGDEY